MRPAREALSRINRCILVMEQNGIPKCRTALPSRRRLARFCNCCPPDFAAHRIAPRTPRSFALPKGSGSSRIGDHLLEWSARDIFVVPSWSTVSHDATEESVLFSFSDRPAQKALGLWREQAPIQRYTPPSRASPTVRLCLHSSRSEYPPARNTQRCSIQTSSVVGHQEGPMRGARDFSR